MRREQIFRKLKATARRKQYNGQLPGIRVLIQEYENAGFFARLARALCFWRRQTA